MNTFEGMWQKLAKSKEYREELVASQLTRGIPFQIQTLMKQHSLTQEELARRAGLSQGVISRAANPNYGKLTLKTIVRIAAGFDVAFIGLFVPFSKLDKWFVDLSEEGVEVHTFDEENEAFEVIAATNAGVQAEEQDVPRLPALPPVSVNAPINLQDYRNTRMREPDKESAALRQHSREQNEIDSQLGHINRGDSESNRGAIHSAL